MFVLVADNQAVFQKILAKILEDEGVDFHICETGAEVIEAMAVRTVDLFMITMNLPDMEGADLCRTIRRTVKDDCIPIIILTSEGREQSFSEAFDAGATDIFRRSKIEYFADYLSHLTEISRPLNARVMILEDSRSQRQMLQQTLSSWGLFVDSFSSSTPALAAHKEDPYDVILTDIELSGLENGLDFVHDIRQQALGIGDVPIIAITAYLSDSTRVNFLARGIDRCMLKPLLMPELRSEIKKQIDARHAKLALDYARQLEVDKSRAKSEFLARMSHELRTSLNAIIGFSELMEMGEDKDPETLEYARKIHGAGKLLLELINEVLDLSRIESGNIKMTLESINLNGILQKCEQVMESFAQDHDIDLQFSHTLKDISVRCDPLRLTEVLLNLISNGIKYNHTGGWVRVTTGYTNNGFVRINVEDNGIGISAANAKEIFEPFSRVHQESLGIQGTGIGLAIADQLIELMGGVLGFSSQEGEGSNFWIDLPPRATTEAQQGIPSTLTDELMPCSVLYVDDNPVNRLLLEKWFSKQPESKLVLAKSAKEGLEKITEKRPDILITDIHMPGESGYWLLNKLRKKPQWETLPVIALSAMAMEDEVERGKLGGFDAYLTKPFDFKVLITTLNSVLAKQTPGTQLIVTDT